MDSLAVHMRITGLSVSNEDVDSRRKAVAQLSSVWGRIKSPSEIVAKAATIAAALGGDGSSPAALSSEIERAVQKHASAFLSSERPLEVGVCAGIAALSMLSSPLAGDGRSMLYSNALWSALSFQPCLREEKREALRHELLERARTRSLESAEKAREREQVQDTQDLEVTIGDGMVTTNFKKFVTGVIEPLRRNAALDREELDFLWWSQLDRSRLLRRRLVDIPEATRLVTMGIEGAALLRGLPADVHREIVLRTVDADPELDLRELLGTIADDRQALAEKIPDVITNAPGVYPLLNTLVKGEATTEGAADGEVGELKVETRAATLVLW
jgi:hypothetical protein